MKIFLPIQAYGSIMCEYFRFGFIDLWPKKKSDRLYQFNLIE